MGDTSLINLGELSKPATVLIEKISDAVGVVFKPYQIVRVAKAEAVAERVRSESQIEISDLQRRALHRFVEEEGKKQRNIEEITSKALPQLEEGSDPKQVEDDWITNFFDRCRLISDDQMQSLWSRVLAGEANAPGTYSKRTVNFLSYLDKSDAELFTRFCGFTWLIDETMPMVFDEPHEIYKEQGIDFDALTHLEAIGLVKFCPNAALEHEVSRTFLATYFGAAVTLTIKESAEDNGLLIGKVLFTKIGRELASISGGKRVDGFFDYACEKWKETGITISTEPNTATGELPLASHDGVAN